MTSFAEKLQRLDAQHSVSREFRVYTVQGAVLSVLTVFLILYLFVSEFYYNFHVTLLEQVHVNATSSRGLEIEFDLTLTNVPCSKLEVDASDMTGQSQSLHLDHNHHVWKHRIRMVDDTTRVLIGERTQLELGSTLKSEADLAEVARMDGKIRDAETLLAEADNEEEEEKCGSCYGAGEEDECCNTCEDVKRAYKRRGWFLQGDGDGDGVVQCQRERGLTIAEDDGEGCNVHGVVALSTGGGNLHLAPGRGAASGGLSILDMFMQTFQEWNVSHTIHKLRFGPSYPGAAYQLDNISRTIQDTSGMYQYYFQVFFFIRLDFL